MKHISSPKYTIAWFKLAEFVTRGEKERALGIYKLLVHSFDDAALALQLQGDLFFAFNDIKMACNRYQQAAELYKQENRMIQAIAVYEHLISIDPHNSSYLQSVLLLYSAVAQWNRLLVHLEKLLLLSFQKNSTTEHILFVKSLALSLSGGPIEKIVTKMVLVCLDHHAPHAIIMKAIHTALDLFSNKHAVQSFNAFMHMLKICHQEYYEEAYQYAQEIGLFIRES